MGVGLYILREMRFFADFAKDSMGIATGVIGNFKIPTSNPTVGNDSPLRLQMEDLFSVRQAVAHMNNADFMDEWVSNAHLLEFGYTKNNLHDNVPRELLQVLKSQCDRALDNGEWSLFRVSPTSPPIGEFETLRKKLKNEERLQRLVFDKAEDFYSVNYVFKFY